MIQYLRSGGRRPVWVGPRRSMEDRQGAVPDGWCAYCGMEVFGKGAVCSRCAEMIEN